MATTVNGICGGQHLDKHSVDGFAGIFGGLGRPYDDACSTLHFLPLLGPD